MLVNNSGGLAEPFINGRRLHTFSDSGAVKRLIPTLNNYHVYRGRAPRFEGRDPN